MRFFKPAIPTDGDLELVPPSMNLIDDFLAAQPLTAVDSTPLWSRGQLLDLLRICPGGFDKGDPLFERWPAYYFWLRARPNGSRQIVGTLAFRISECEQIHLYYGHIGYSVFPAARGHHYAERATRLILPLARKHAIPQLWITANPDNLASRRTCERLGADLVDIVDVPSNTRLYHRGDRQKCRYRLRVDAP